MLRHHLRRVHAALLAALLVPGLALPVGAGEEEPAEEPPQVTKPEPPPPAPETKPGQNHEAAAERLERRDEVLGAQMEYLEALKAALAATPAAESPLHWGRCEFLMEKILELAGLTGETGDLLDLLRGFLADTAKAKLEPPLPLMRARAAWIQAQLLLRQGQADKARALTDSLGLLRYWMFVGPFDNERGRSFDTPFGPEKGTVDLRAQYTGKKRPVSWRFLHNAQPLGFVPCREFFRPDTECLAYALCLVQSPKQQRAALRLGCDNAIAAWLNGQPVCRYPEAGEYPPERRADLDQVPCAVQLQKGWNALLIKCGQAKGPWRFCARFTDLEGKPLAGLTVAKDPDAIRAALAKVRLAVHVAGDAKEAARPDRGAISLLSRRLREPGADPRLFYYTGYLVMRRQLGGANRNDLELLRLAAKFAPTEPIYFLTMAQAASDAGRSLPDREENLHRDALERARALGHEEVVALVGLAEHYFDSMNNYHRAGALIHHALRINPLSPRALLLQFRLQRHYGWDAQAELTLRSLVRNFPRALAVRLAEGPFMLHHGSSTQALQAYTAALEADATDPAALLGRVNVLRRLHRNEAAQDALQAYIQLSPYAGWAHRRLIEALYHDGHLDEAIQAASHHLAFCPEDHESLALKGYALREAGREKEAHVAWDRAMALQPSFPALQRYLDFLEPKRAPNAEAEFDLAGFVKACADYAPPPGESLAFLLHEQRDTVHGDGTRSRTAHAVIRVLDRDGAERLRRKTIYFNEQTETVTVHVARVLHPDGRVRDARVLDNYFGKSGPQLVLFPALSKGDVVELHYRIDRFRPDFFGNYFGEIYFFRRTEPVRHARYVLQSPTTHKYYFHRTGGTPKPIHTIDRDHKTEARVWEMRDLPPIPDEPFMPPKVEVSPTVQISTFADWDALAKWYWHLIAGQNVATPEIRHKVTELTRTCKTDQQRIAAIYDWVTRHIRNEAWEFGVHGYKPYSANTIFNRAFGDCKDKATLINVMAREIGLKAWPVLLEATDPTEPVAGRGREDLTLPLLAHFNHCIAHVQVGERPYFLDGTVQYRTIESVPTTDAGAAAVIVTPEGAIRTTVPVHTSHANLWEDEFDLRLDPQGHAEIEQTLTGSGQVAVYMRAYFALPPGWPKRHEQRYWDAKVRRVASRYYGVPSSATGSFTNQNLPPDTVRLQSRALIRRYARPQANGRILVPLPKAFLRGELGKGYALPAPMSLFARHSTREHDVVLPMVFLVQRKLTIAWPLGWHLVNVLTDTAVEEDFGGCKVHYEAAANSLTIDYRLELKQARIPQAAYARFRRLCVLADRIDETRLILEKE